MSNIIKFYICKIYDISVNKLNINICISNKAKFKRIKL
jgi:hypothetical protein